MKLKVFETKRITTKVMYKRYVKTTVDKWWADLIEEKQIEVFNTHFPRIKFKPLGERDMKVLYRKEVSRILTYEEFKQIVSDLNKTIVEECLTGGTYNFGNSVGFLRIVKFFRDPYVDAEGNLKGVAIDFGATKKNKEAGGQNAVYHTNRLVCRWFWSKKHSNIPNRRKWCFEPTDGPKGISRKLHHFIDKNPRAPMHYPELTLKRKTNVENSK